MNLKHQELRHFITSFSELFTPAICQGLLTETSLNLLSEIMDRGGKQASEAVLVLLYGIRYVQKNRGILRQIATDQEFLSILESQRDELLALGIIRKVQGNLAERALPLIELLAELTSSDPHPNSEDPLSETSKSGPARVSRSGHHSGSVEQATNPTLGKSKEPGFRILELGCSFGVIGMALLNHRLALAQPESFFKAEQQLPSGSPVIEDYLGIDVSPPDREWLLSCIYDQGDGDRLERFLDQTQNRRIRPIIQGSAIGFSQMPLVQDFLQQSKPSRRIILTSFMMYQLPEEIKIDLKSEIQGYIRDIGGYWINQDVSISSTGGEPKYYLECNSSLKYTFKDDKCTTWTQIDPL